jgi:ABC-type bacteriocin/lantibiotic exporter with double-glycine peptidase domain
MLKSHGAEAGHRRWLVPEVIQVSAMDCGPAALKCLLEGFNIPASYERLREACQTSVDGTSIDVLETVAQQLGLAAEQVMLPKDHLWLPEARTLPALIVVRQPSGSSHFVVVWRRHGRWLQVMDPATGRHWIGCENFNRELFIHAIPVPAHAWREWVVTEEAIGLFESRLQVLGIPLKTRHELIERGKQDDSWEAMAKLDAAIRLVGRLVAMQGLGSGVQATRLLEALVVHGSGKHPDVRTMIPNAYWSVRQTPAAAETEELTLRGAVLLRIRGRRNGEEAGDSTLLPGPELVAALNEQPTRPLLALWKLLSAEGVKMPLALAGILGLTVGGLLVEALLFRGFFDVARDLSIVSQRSVALGLLVLVVVALWLMEVPIIVESMRLGRHLELRLRLLLAEKLPTLNDRYLQSRSISDMADRAHSLYLSRNLPEVIVRLVRGGWELMLVLLGIGFIAPASLPLASVLALMAVVIPLLAQPVASERDLRMRSHAGALSRFYLDALLGVVPIRAHCAERSVLIEHESLLTDWVRAAWRVLGLTLYVKGLQASLCLVLTGALMYNHLATVGVTGELLLLVYWVLKLPALGESLAEASLQLPAQRNIARRLLEPINADNLEPTTSGQCPAESVRVARPYRPGRLPTRRKGVAIAYRDVDVVAAGHRVLEKINWQVAAGEHLAIVGPSGAGKSSLVGLLLGWHSPAHGQVWIDRTPLCNANLEALRACTAWLDPAVQLWNRSLLDNLRYSPCVGADPALSDVLAYADLLTVVGKMPEGLQTPLGEGGASVSGGEGQRVRLARTLWQEGVRLAILDEPFRGVDRDQRHRLLSAVRQHWRDATLICITHDLAETMAFDRVIVIEGGRLVEDGSPQKLRKRANSRYRGLLDSEEAVRRDFWEADVWRRIRLEAGQINELPRIVPCAKSGATHEHA